jgi:hypothetical protein
MPQVCTVCTSPDREEIDRQLAAGEGAKRRIATRYSLTESAIRRHEARHLDPALIAALRPSLEARVDLAKEAIGHCRWLVEKAREQSEKVLEREAASSGVVCPFCGQRPNPFKDWIDPLNRAIASLGKFTGELANDQVSALFINLGVSGEPELRNRLGAVPHNVSIEEAEAAAVEALLFVWRERPERRTKALAMLQRESYAEVIETNGNGAHP